MNHSAVRYKRKLKRKLQCSRGTKADLLADFTHSLDGFLDENPDATFADLGNAFGPPEEMANILMDKVNDHERHSYKVRQLVQRIVVGILAAILLLVTIYIFFIKQHPLVRDADVSTSNKFVVTETFIEGE